MHIFYTATHASVSNPVTVTLTHPHSPNITPQKKFFSAAVLESREHNCPKFDPVASLNGVTV